MTKLYIILRETISGGAAKSKLARQTNNKPINPDNRSVIQSWKVFSLESYEILGSMIARHQRGESWSKVHSGLIGLLVSCAWLVCHGTAALSV